MPYNSKIVDTFNKAYSNSGSMDPNSPDVGVGLVGSPACGDVLQFFIRIKNNKVEEACFQTFGCGSAIASSSLLVDKVKNRTLSEALKITNKEIYKELGLPPVKYHCSVLAESAVQEAIKDWKSKQQKPMSKL